MNFFTHLIRVFKKNWTSVEFCKRDKLFKKILTNQKMKKRTKNGFWRLDYCFAALLKSFGLHYWPERLVMFERKSWRKASKINYSGFRSWLGFWWIRMFEFFWNGCWKLNMVCLRWWTLFVHEKEEVASSTSRIQETSVTWRQ